MFGYNFTHHVRKVLQLAREHATLLRHEYVGTEHILLGIITEGEAVASAVLADLHVDRRQLRDKIDKSLETGTAAPRADLPYSSRGRKTLELAVTEARELGHSYVGTAHLLLGLLHSESTPAVTFLAGEGATLNGARAVLGRLCPTEIPTKD